MSMILSEAFKELKFLSEDAFELNDEGIDELKNFVDSDEEDDTVDVIDPEAESEEDLEDSYLGKVILDCAVCHSKVYKDAEDVKVEDGAELANTDEECPFCYTTDGFKVIGQVANYQPLDDIKVEVEDEDGNGQAEVEVKAEESLKSRKSLKEADNKKPVYTKPNGDYLVKGNGGYTAFNKNNVCLGGISVDDEYIAIQCFKRNELDESLVEAGNMSNYVDRRPNAGSIGNDLFNVYETGLNGRKCIAQGVNIDKANKLRKQGSRDGFITVYNVNKDPYADKKESLGEALDEVSLTADGQKYTIKAEPNEEVPGEEVIAPVTPEVEDEITANSEGEADVEVDDFSEEEFDDLGESYLKEVYDNVKSYKTSGVTSKGNKLTVEGVITFNSGKQKKTQFVFEAKDITKRGKARFIGENKQICRGSKAFTLTGSIKSGKFLSESFNYNYRAGGSKRVYGTIKRK